MNLFSDEQVRRDFTIGITEVLAQIYKVTDPTIKKSIFDELAKLTDEELLAKKDLIERYLEQSAQLGQTYLSKAIQIENEYAEKEERKELATQNLY